MKLTKTIFILHIIVGIGAIFGGIGALSNINEPMGMPAESLNGSFDNFLIPGLFLLIILGLGNLLCTYLIKKDTMLCNYVSSFWGFLMMSWIIIQCLILQSVVALHVIFFIIGFIQLLLNLVILKREVKFPFNVLSDYF